jgi:hypothetical protein
MVDGHTYWQKRTKTDGHTYWRDTRHPAGVVLQYGDPAKEHQEEGFRRGGLAMSTTKGFDNQSFRKRFFPLGYRPPFSFRGRGHKEIHHGHYLLEFNAGAEDLVFVGGGSDNTFNGGHFRQIVQGELGGEEVLFLGAEG